MIKLLILSVIKVCLPFSKLNNANYVKRYLRMNFTMSSSLSIASFDFLTILW